MGGSISHMESLDNDCDFVGSAFLEQRRRTITSRPYDSREQKREHLIRLDKWREEETQEQNEHRRRTLSTYKSKAKIYRSIDIPSWEKSGWNIPNTQLSDQFYKEHSCITKYAANDSINSRVALFRGDIMALEVDAITNAANNSMLGGGGIDGAIHAAAGPLLLRDTAAMNGLRTGKAKISKGYNLPARYIVHTAGPTEENAEELISSYTSVLNLAVQHKIESLALCCVSTGIFGFPLLKATDIALKTVREFFEKKPNLKLYVIFVVFLSKEESIYNKLMPVYFPLNHSENAMPEDPILLEQRKQDEVRSRSSSLEDMKQKGSSLLMYISDSDNSVWSESEQEDTNGEQNEPAAEPEQEGRHVGT